ncbi:MAG TPA: hypothetical protein VGY54_16460 [Polyangiaceae bacterium]|nr:hypothetical protein [Polyangiaceae bacterium]
MRYGILKVRLDDHLRRLLQQHVAEIQVRDPDATLSSVARNVLREGLAQRLGRPASMADAGYREGFARAFSEVRRVVQEAMRTVAPPKEPR